MTGTIARSWLQRPDSFGCNLYNGTSGTKLAEKGLSFIEPTLQRFFRFANGLVQLD